MSWSVTWQVRGPSLESEERVIVRDTEFIRCRVGAPYAVSGLTRSRPRGASWELVAPEHGGHRMFAARAAMMTNVVIATVAPSMKTALARRVNGRVSVGLNAVDIVKPTNR